MGPRVTSAHRTVEQPTPRPRQLGHGPAARLYAPGMTHNPEQDAVETREQLLPEELEAGSDDPEAQARAILAESEERTLHPEQTRDDSTQTPGETHDHPGQSPA